MLYKAIASGKEWRKPYRGAKAVVYSCRNHGRCAYCTSNRLANSKRREEAADQQIADYWFGEDDNDNDNSTEIAGA